VMAAERAVRAGGDPDANFPAAPGRDLRLV
jgi:hypothetical protein